MCGWQANFLCQQYKRVFLIDMMLEVANSYEDTKCETQATTTHFTND